MENKKHDWKKDEKTWYSPKTQPEELTLPSFGFFILEGSGSPDSQDFQVRVEALYALSYAIRMSSKSGTQPDGFYEYTVYPLEGIWSLGGKSLETAILAKKEKRPAPAFDRGDFIYRLMIRQPDFVTSEYAQGTIATVKMKKHLPVLDHARFEIVTEGRCVQMLHLGPYSEEPQSFTLMKDYCRKESLARVGMDHREIYLSDARKTSPEKLKTILRFPVRDDFSCV